MRHPVNANDLSAILNALNALATTASRASKNGELPSLRTAETWVDRISKERWTGEKGLAVVSAVVGVGAILYGARKFLAHDKSDERKR